MAEVKVPEHTCDCIRKVGKRELRMLREQK